MTGLVKAVDEQIAKQPELKSFVVVLTDDGDTTADALKALAKDQKIRSVPLTVYENLTGPASYQIAKGAEITVMMWRGTEVKVNQAFAPGQLDEGKIKALLAELPKILKR